MVDYRSIPVACCKIWNLLLVNRDLPSTRNMCRDSHLLVLAQVTISHSAIIIICPSISYLLTAVLHEKLNKVAAGRLARTILNIHFQVDTSLSGSHTGVFPNPKCFLEEGKRTVHFIHDSRSTEIRSTAASLLFFFRVWWFVVHRCTRFSCFII